MSVGKIVFIFIGRDFLEFIFKVWKLEFLRQFFASFVGLLFESMIFRFVTRARAGSIGITVAFITASTASSTHRHFAYNITYLSLAVADNLANIIIHDWNIKTALNHLLYDCGLKIPVYKLPFLGVGHINYPSRGYKYFPESYLFWESVPFSILVPFNEIS